MTKEESQRGKMQFRKEKLTKEEWILDTGKTQIPVSSIKAMFQVAMFVMLAFWAHNLGTVGAMDIVRYSAYISGGICDYTTGECLQCLPKQEGTKVTWDCQEVLRNYTAETNISDLIIGGKK